MTTSSAVGKTGWAEAVEVQAIAADLVAHLLGDLLDRRPQPIQPDVVDPAAARAHHVRVSAGNVRVVAIRSLAELELEHLACGVQSVERLVDSGPAIIGYASDTRWQSCSALGCSPPSTSARTTA